MLPVERLSCFFSTKKYYSRYRKSPYRGNILKLECEGLVGPVATSLASLEKWFFAPLKNLLSAFLRGRSQLFSLNWEIFAKFHQLRIWLIFYQFLCWEKTPLCSLCEMGGIAGTSSQWCNVKFSKCQIYLCMWWCNLASCCANERINFHNVEINSAVDISLSFSTN